MRFTSMWEGDINQKIRIVLGLLFIALGIWIMAGDVLPPQLDAKFHYVMGFIFVAYGIFRMVHAEYRKNLMKYDDQDATETNENDE